MCPRRLGWRRPPSKAAPSLGLPQREIERQHTTYRRRAAGPDEERLLRPAVGSALLAGQAEVPTCASQSESRAGPLARLLRWRRGSDLRARTGAACDCSRTTWATTRRVTASSTARGTAPSRLRRSRGGATASLRTGQSDGDCYVGDGGEGARPIEGAPVMRVERLGLDPVGQSCFGLWGEHHLAVNACRALRSVTRRTLNSVFARERSINFCRLRTLARSPAFDAVKIRCRSRRTSSSTRRQSTACQSKGASSGPFTTPSTAVVASNLSSGSGASVIFLLAGSPDRVSALSGRTTRVRIRPVIRNDQLEELATVVSVSRRLSATGIRFSAILFPPRSWALLAVGLPDTPIGAPGPRRGYRVPRV